MSVPDYALESTVDFKFTSRAFATGIPTTLAGTPAIEVYEDNDTTQITAGITLTVDFDGVTGLNNLRIAATAANGFEAGKSYHAVLSAGTVGGVSVVGEVVAQFSLGRHIHPTVAGRNLNVGSSNEIVTVTNINNVTSGAISAASFGAGAITSTVIASNALTPAKFAQGAIPQLIQNTTIATLATQVSFTLTDGSTDDGTYVGMLAIITDASTATQKAIGVISAYTGSTKTVTLREDPGVFTMAATDFIEIVAQSPDGAVGLAALATAQADLDIITGADGVNLLSATQASIDAIEADTNELQTDDIPGTLATIVAYLDTEIAAILADTNELQTDWVDGGRLDLILDIVAADTTTDIPALIATAQADLDILTGADGANLLSATQASIDAIETGVNVTQINSSSAAAIRLALSAGQIIPATVDTVTNTHTPTTTEFQADDITEATDDHFNGRIVIFLTGALVGQATDITDYAAVGGIGQFTVTALTEAPADDDTFIIV